MFVRAREYFKATQFNRYGDHHAVNVYQYTEDDEYYSVWINDKEILVSIGDWILEKNNVIIRVIDNEAFQNEYELDD